MEERSLCLRLVIAPSLLPYTSTCPGALPVHIKKQLEKEMKTDALTVFAGAFLFLVSSALIGHWIHLNLFCFFTSLIVDHLRRAQELSSFVNCRHQFAETSAGLSDKNQLHLFDLTFACFWICNHFSIFSFGNIFPSL